MGNWLQRLNSLCFFLWEFISFFLKSKVFCNLYAWYSSWYISGVLFVWLISWKNPRIHAYTSSWLYFSLLITPLLFCTQFLMLFHKIWTRFFKDSFCCCVCSRRINWPEELSWYISGVLFVWLISWKNPRIHAYTSSWLYFSLLITPLLFCTQFLMLFHKIWTRFFKDFFCCCVCSRRINWSEELSCNLRRNYTLTFLHDPWLPYS